MFTHKLRYFFALALGSYSYLNTIFSNVYTAYKIEAPWYISLSVMIAITILVWDGNCLVQKILSKFYPSLQKLHLILVGFLIGIILASAASLLLVYSVETYILHNSNEVLEMPMKLAFTYSTRVNLFLHIINALFIYGRAYKTAQLEAAELKRITAQAQLQSIKNQINPHFLFNNLNVLASLVMKENADANKFIEEFSSVYRHMLNNQEKELIPLQEEIAFIKPYIYLLEKRFPESIAIHINIAEKYYSWYMVPIALQMLIENAIKHNVLSKAKPLTITLSANGNQQISVSNNRQPKLAAEPSTQLGLQNIAKRYEIITREKIKIENNAITFSVSLPLISPRPS
jgi:two-component system, LytTR family, sensor kinase